MRGPSSSDLTLTDKSSAGCACCAPQDASAQSVPAAADDVTASYAVTDSAVEQAGYQLTND